MREEIVLNQRRAGGHEAHGGDDRTWHPGEPPLESIPIVRQPDAQRDEGRPIDDRPLGQLQGELRARNTAMQQRKPDRARGVDR